MVELPKAIGCLAVGMFIGLIIHDREELLESVGQELVTMLMQNTLKFSP